MTAAPADPTPPNWRSSTSRPEARESATRTARRYRLPMSPKHRRREAALSQAIRSRKTMDESG
jgi:hypothetical protein